MKTDECESNPCENGGTCTDGKNFYICNCATGFIGMQYEANNEL